MTDASGLVHMVTDDAMAAGRLADRRYLAACGSELLPASLTTPARRYCQPCRDAPRG